MNSESTIQYLYSAANHGLGNNASDAVFQQVWLSIVNGDLEGGAVVTEESLARKLNVSRTPMREAIQRLIACGLLQRVRSRTLCVSELSIEAMVNLTCTRERLEGLVGWHVWDRHQRGEISLESLETLHNRHKALASTEDTIIMLEMGLQFHHQLRKLCGNDVAVNALEHLLLALEPYRRLVKMHTQRCQEIIDEHTEIVILLRGKSGEAVEFAMRRHIAEARDFYKGCLLERKLD